MWYWIKILWYSVKISESDYKPALYSGGASELDSGSACSFIMLQDFVCKSDRTLGYALHSQAVHLFWGLLSRIFMICTSGVPPFCPPSMVMGTAEIYRQKHEVTEMVGILPWVFDIITLLHHVAFYVCGISFDTNTYSYTYFTSLHGFIQSPR